LTERGKKLPLDYDPVGAEVTGAFVLRDDIALSVPPLVFASEPHYISHFATCPDADEWRRTNRDEEDDE
jgi:hypothetical protein